MAGITGATVAGSFALQTDEEDDAEGNGVSSGAGVLEDRLGWVRAR